MSPGRSATAAARLTEAAPVFAALGDTTRLAVVARLCTEGPLSIVRLSDESGVTRQAITKHLRVLERAGVVHGVRTGREIRFELDPAPITELKEYLEFVSAQWDQALGRLKVFVED